MRRLALAVFLLWACGGPDLGPRPDAPEQNDPQFTVGELPAWTMVGDSLTPGDATLSISITAPPSVSAIAAWVPEAEGVALARDGDRFVGEVSIEHLPPGAYQIVFAADRAEVGFAAHRFNRSHALYVLVGTDWDDPDNPEESYRLQSALHVRYPELKITHFAAPYTFTDPTVTEQRRAEIAAWLIQQRDDHGDEIGLHIHPYCNFVESAGLACKTEPSTVYEAGDDTGYTVMVAAYDRGELAALLEHADQLFEAAGLGKPTSFRAGGWTADVHTLQALADSGYVADTSALNWTRMEEWEGVQNGVLYEWNSTQWSQMSDTSQPYYPGTADIQADGGADAIGVLQVPDNGIMVDYVAGSEMVEIFEANWDGGPLSEPRQVTYGFHPPNYNAFYHGQLQFALDHIDQLRASAGTGPVVYANLSDLVSVWAK